MRRSRSERSIAVRSECGASLAFGGTLRVIDGHCYGSPAARQIRRYALPEPGVPWLESTIQLGDDVLENGPGPGLTTDLLRHRVAAVTAVEIDADPAVNLKVRLTGTNVEVIWGDGTELPLPDARFTAATCFAMLHHMPSEAAQDQLFGELHRVLRPGGRRPSARRPWCQFPQFDDVLEECVRVTGSIAVVCPSLAAEMCRTRIPVDDPGVTKAHGRAATALDNVQPAPLVVLVRKSSRGQPPWQSPLVTPG